MNKEEKEEFDILVELGVLQSEVRKVDRHIHNNYRKKIYKLEKRINKAIEHLKESIDDYLKDDKDLDGTCNVMCYETIKKDI